MLRIMSTCWGVKCITDALPVGFHFIYSKTSIVDKNTTNKNLIFASTDELNAVSDQHILCNEAALGSISYLKPYGWSA